MDIKLLKSWNDNWALLLSLEIVKDLSQLLQFQRTLQDSKLYRIINSVHAYFKIIIPTKKIKISGLLWQTWLSCISEIAWNPYYLKKLSEVDSLALCCAFHVGVSNNYSLIRSYVRASNKELYICVIKLHTHTLYTPPQI